MPTILIADDQKHMLMLLQASLASMGGEILTACSGVEVLARAAATTIDMLLIDFEMPGLTGVETVRQLKQNPRYSQLPIIMLTGRGQNRIRAEAVAAGVTLIILKPFSPKELMDTVAKLLRQPIVEPE